MTFFFWSTNEYLIELKNKNDFSEIKGGDNQMGSKRWCFKPPILSLISLGIYGWIIYHPIALLTSPLDRPKNP